MSIDTAADTAPRKTLAARHIIFFVIAAAAPLGFAVGAMPISIGRGGIGFAGALLVVGIVLGALAIGIIAVSQYLNRPGGLYAFVGAGLGAPLGVGAAYLAALVYAFASIGAIGAFGAFASAAATHVFGINLPWLFWAAFAIAIMGVLGAINIDLSAKVLGVIIVLEVGVLLLLGFAIVFQGGAAGLDLQPYAPSEVFNSKAGIIFAAAIAAFAGFEATVIYGGEARNRRTTLRRATFGSVAILAVLYTFVAWTLIMAYGSAEAVAAANADPINLFFSAMYTYVGEWAVKVMEVLVVTSLLASIIAFHNATARYLAAMGSDALIPRFFGVHNARFGSPMRASALHTALAVLLVLIVFVSGADPYLDLYVIGSAPAIIGIPLLEVFAGIAIVVLLIRLRHAIARAVPIAVATAIATVLIGVVVVLISLQLPDLTLRTDWVNGAILGAIAVFILVGIVRGAVLSRGGSLPSDLSSPALDPSSN